MMNSLAQKKGASGSVKDNRDGKSYRTIQVGGQVWMAENLNFRTGEATCYKNDPVNCDSLGLLYTVEEAETACPEGWHLPTGSEVETLLKNAGGVQDTAQKFLWKYAGYSLKSKSGYEDYDEGLSGNGYDALGFDAKPAGRYAPDFLEFYYKGVGAYFAVSRKDSPCEHYAFLLGFDSGDATLSCQDEGASVTAPVERFSVRCLKD